MSILVAAILLTAVLVVAPISALKNAVSAGGFSALLAFIGALLCLPLGNGWYAVVTSNGYGDGWREVSALALGFVSAAIGSLVSMWALSSARDKEQKFQQTLRKKEVDLPTPERTQLPTTNQDL
ncbi:hypothetical protein MHM39_14790 [Phaeobacter sp. CNT1-3]|nr:hypothetical protein [Phaeobacter sp. CNT1-3]